MVVPWRILEQRLDGIVDGQWAEPLELHPYMVDPSTSQPTVDATRSIIKTTVAVLMRPGAAATGEGAIMGGQFRTEQASGDVWLTMRLDQMVDPSSWHQGDRIYLPDRTAYNEPDWFEISWIAPSATARYDIHLTVLEPGG